MFSIADNLENVSRVIKKASDEAGRSPRDIQLLAVSKKKPPALLLEAMALGVSCFGESYLNEALDKQEEIKAQLPQTRWEEIQWHFIGPIQSNKTRPIAAHFDWVQSIDRAKIAQRLSDQRPAELPTLNVCIQINVDQESTKSGITLEEVAGLAEQIDALPGLTLRGLMAIPKAAHTPEQSAESFQKMYQAFELLRSQYDTVDTLSMGMSRDIALAISQGSTMVRVGTALFGERA